MRTVILILSLAVFGFGCAKKPDPQAPCNFVQNSDLQRVSWKSNVPYQIYIDSSLPSQFHDSVRAAAATWNTKLGKTAVNIIDNTSTPPFGQDGVSVLYWLTDWPTDRTWEQARTTIYWEDTLIIEADIKVNGRDYSYSAGTTDTVSSTSVDFQSLILHELGHSLGLVHIQDTTSVMEPSLAYGQDRRIPGLIDLTSLHCEY